MLIYAITLAVIEMFGIIICLLIFRHKIKNLKSEYDKKSMFLLKTIDQISENLNRYRDRTIELEDAREKGYGVKARIETTEIKTDFKKLEWVVMLSGVQKLLNDAKNVEDSKVYIKVIEHIQSFVDKMKEEEFNLEE